MNPNSSYGSPSGPLENVLRYTWHDGQLKGLRPPGYAKILLIGAGGCGCNTVDRMMDTGCMGVECIAVNTDRAHLDTVKSHRSILIGEKTTRGLGAGGNPAIGKAAIEESIGLIEPLLEGCDICFVSAGMGGGTGTAAAPVIADLAQKKGALVVGVVTMPFKHEKGRLSTALDGLNKMRRSSNTVVIVENDRLMGLVPNLAFDEAFKVADTTLANMISGITDTISRPSLINLDFADIRAMMIRGGVTFVGIGQSNAPNRSEEAVIRALNNPLLDVSYEGANGALVHVSGDNSMTLSEVTRSAEIVSEMIDENAYVFWGARVDPALSGMLKVTLLLTGVRSPHLMTGYGLFPVELYNVEPDAGMEERLPIDLGLYQLESND
ncbi:MAG: cell division protein FtsZ [Candidatus Brockarchaeota archaeon]|nr:cell division protein FtsZ [Candidatus Brockarchaeota archaeon]